MDDCCTTAVGNQAGRAVKVGHIAPTVIKCGHGEEVNSRARHEQNVR